MSSTIGLLELLEAVFLGWHFLFPNLRFQFRVDQAIHLYCQSGQLCLQVCEYRCCFKCAVVDLSCHTCFHLERWVQPLDLPWKRWRRPWWEFCWNAFCREVCLFVWIRLQTAQNRFYLKLKFAPLCPDLSLGWRSLVCLFRETRPIPRQHNIIKKIFIKN